MSNLDPSVAHLVDKTPTTNHTSDQIDSDDEDALIASLENEDHTDPALSALRAARLEQLHHEFSHATALRSHGTGTYTTLTTDKAVLDATTDREVTRCVIHFSKADFGRCAVMDSHLERLAGPHYEARFIKVDVENVPFLVEKLKVRVLPCVLGFIDGKSVERVVGFEGLGNGHRFTTEDLEQKLVDARVLVRMKVGQQGGAKDSDGEDDGWRKEGKSIRDRQKTNLQDDDEDWD
jgi:hypothetical protein